MPSLPHRSSQHQTAMPHIEDTKPNPKDDPEVAAEKRQKIQVKNRRKLYLDRHPSYFTSPDLELTGCVFLLFILLFIID